MDTKQLKAIENIKRAVDVNDSDTLSMLSGDGQVLWNASGSWSCSENVTLGDLRAIAAIAPPVAAGSVDIEDLLDNFAVAEIERRPTAEPERSAIIAWGAQQREAGRLEGKASNETLLRASVNEMDAMERERDEARQRAEKAEADLKQVNEWRAAALQENMRLSDLWMDRVTRSEARAKELERALSNGTAKPSLLNSASFLGSNEQT